MKKVQDRKESNYEDRIGVGCKKEERTEYEVKERNRRERKESR